MEKDKETGETSAEQKTDKVEKTPSDKTKQTSKQAEDQTKDKKPNKQPAPKPKSAKSMTVAGSNSSFHGSKKASLLLGGLGLVIAILAVFGAFYNYSQWQNMANQGQSMLNEQVQLGSALQDLRDQITELNTHNKELKSQIDGANQAIERSRDRQAAMQVSLEHIQELNQQKGHIPLFWKYAEVEYLLNIANQRLILQHDIDTAKQALSDADARLKAIGDPALIPIRGKIADELTALNSIERPDVAGMSARLQSLVQGIEQLPLISKEHLLTIKPQDQQDREIDSWTELPGTIWKDIKSLVEIKRNDGQIQPLLAPDERHYLSQNLGLKLEESRIALLNRDTPLFRQNLSDTREWVERYFDKESFAVTNVVSTVNELKEIELTPELPDISGSLRQLRDWIEQYKSQQNAALQPRSAVNVVSNRDLPTAAPGQENSP